jgi:hypothetical protein
MQTGPGIRKGGLLYWGLRAGGKHATLDLEQICLVKTANMLEPGYDGNCRKAAREPFGLAITKGRLGLRQSLSQKTETLLWQALKSVKVARRRSTALATTSTAVKLEMIQSLSLYHRKGKSVRSRRLDWYGDEKGMSGMHKLIFHRKNI